MLEEMKKWSPIRNTRKTGKGLRPSLSLKSEVCVTAHCRGPGIKTEDNVKLEYFSPNYMKRGKIRTELERYQSQPPLNS